MNIPKSVKVGGVTYDVKIVDNPMGDQVGETNFRDAVIYIAKSKSQDFMNETFIHELVHTIYANAGYAEVDELTVEGIAQSLYGVIVDNDELF